MSIISNCLIGKNKMGTWVFSRILYSRNRDITFDLIRACSMIFIVCILHFSQYTFYEEWYKTYFAEVITGVSLSFFTFISGFFTCKSFRSGKALLFYRDRFIRIYPLYIFSALSLFAIHDIKSVGALFYSFFLCAGCLFGNSPRTIWYICMLSIFYAITPSILLCKKLSHKIIKALIIYCILFAIIRAANGDMRIVLYYPFFVIGLFFSSEKNSLKKRVVIIERIERRIIWMLIILSVASVLLFHVGANMKGIFRFINKYVLYSIFMIIIYILAKLFINKKGSIKWILNGISIVSYASFCMYLFHRVVYYAYKMLVCGGENVPVWAGIIVYPMVLVISLIVQLSYDCLIDFWSSKKYVLSCNKVNLEK